MSRQPENGYKGQAKRAELASQSQSSCAQPSRFYSISTKPNFLIHVRDFQIHSTKNLRKMLNHSPTVKVLPWSFIPQNSLHWDRLKRRALLMCEGISSKKFAATEGYLLAYMNWPNVEAEREREIERGANPWIAELEISHICFLWHGTNITVTWHSNPNS